MKKKTKICLSVALTVVLVILFLVYRMGSRFVESYAAWNTTKIVAAYIVQNEGKLPKQWNDLVNVYDGYGIESINSFKETVEIEFGNGSIQILTISRREPLYNRPNQEIQQLQRELKLPKSERKSVYWPVEYTKIPDER